MKKIIDKLNLLFKDMEKTLYVFGILFGLGMIAYYVILHIFGIMAVCPIRFLTGIPCFGCGGSRAFFSLIHFRFLDAIRYNCCVVIMIFAYMYFFIITSLRYFVNPKIRKVKIKSKYIYIFMVMLLIQYVIKLVLLFNGHDEWI